jgi:hypothetical protein
MGKHRGHSPSLPRFPMTIHLLRPFPPENAYPAPRTTVTSIAGRLGQGRTGPGQGNSSTLPPVPISFRTARTGRTPHHQTIDEAPLSLPCRAENAERGAKPLSGLSGCPA